MGKMNEAVVEEASANRLSAKSIDSVVKALIPLSSTAPEADTIVQEFKEELRGDDDVPRLEAKYDYVAGLFGIDKNARRNCSPVDASPKDRAATDYYSLLSVLILRKWG